MSSGIWLEAHRRDLREALRRISAYRDLWIPDLAVVLVLMIGTWLVFRLTSLDMEIERACYFAAGGGKPWALQYGWPWRWFYRYAGLAVLMLALATFAFLVLGYFKPRLRVYRVHCFLVILALGLGPGLVVNLVFKEQWGRPRPVQVREFGGRWEYRGVLDKGHGGKGKSFPCGHSSVGYFLSVFYFLFRRQRRRLGVLMLLLAVVLGTGMGLARMLAGAHFPSDVLWSAYLVFLVALVLYYFVINVPWREDKGTTAGSMPSRRSLAIGAALMVAIALGSLLAMPIYSEVLYTSQPMTGAPVPVEIRITVAGCDVDLAFQDSDVIRV